MQNRYVADVGDFGKYGLLRALLGVYPADSDARLRLGVHWYLTPDEGHNNDGRYTGYLSRTPQNLARFRECDPDLYDALGDVLQRGRKVNEVERAGIFPADTVYFIKPLSFEDLPGPRSREQRLSRRDQWTGSATETLSDCDVVFVDPDNGLETRATRHTLTGPKYAFYDELAPYLDRGQSLVIYHHIGRQGTAEAQVQLRATELKRLLKPSDELLTLLYHRGSARAFFILASGLHGRLLKTRVASLEAGPWRAHFDGSVD